MKCADKEKADGLLGDAQSRVWQTLHLLTSYLSIYPSHFYTECVYLVQDDSNRFCHPHTVICRNPKYFFGAKISIGFPALNFFQCIVGEESGLPFFVSGLEMFPTVGSLTKCVYKVCKVE